MSDMRDKSASQLATALASRLGIMERVLRALRDEASQVADGAPDSTHYEREMARVEHWCDKALKGVLPYEVAERWLGLPGKEKD